MKISVSRSAHFNSAHRLHNPSLSAQENQTLFGKCNSPNYHGHNYNLIVTVRGEIDSTTGYVYDTKKLKDLIAQEIEARFDHKNLNLDTEEFRNLNPTAEHIAAVIWKLLRSKIPKYLDLKVKLYETERNFVECEG